MTARSLTDRSATASRRACCGTRCAVLIDNWHGHSTVPVAQPVSASVELGLRLHRARPAALGAAAGGDRAAQPVRRAVGRRTDAAHRVQPGGRPTTPTSPARPSGGPRRWPGTRRSTPPASSSRRCTPPRRCAWSTRLGDDGAGLRARGSTPAWSPRTPTSAGGAASGRPAWRRSCIPGRPGWTTRRPGTPRCGGAGRPGAVRHLHPPRPRSRRRPPSAPPTRTTPATSGWPLAYRDHGYDDDWVRAEGEFWWSTRPSTPCGPGRSSPWPTSRSGSARTRPGIGPRRSGSPKALVDQLWRGGRRHLPRPRRPNRAASWRTGRSPALIPLVLPGPAGDGRHGARTTPW